MCLAPEMGVGSRMVSQDNDLKSGNATKGKKQSFIVSLGDWVFSDV